MIRKYRYLTLLSILLILIGILIWTLTRRTSLQVAEGKLREASSYGEIKGVWLEYQKDLSDSPEWIDLVNFKLARVDLNASQKEDLKHWLTTYQEGTTTSAPPKAAPDTSSKAAPQQVPDPPVSVEENGLSGAALADFYNRQGDEKCKAFKAASAPHLYHIANEYYERAAAITHTKPSVCE